MQVDPTAVAPNWAPSQLVLGLTQLAPPAEGKEAGASGGGQRTCQANAAPATLVTPRSMTAY